MKLPLKKSIPLWGILIVILTLIIGVTTIFLHLKSKSMYSVIIEQKNKTQILNERMIQHLHWMNQLLEVIINGKRFTGQTDDTKCDFGKWYYSLKGTAQFEELTNEQKKLFISMEKHHKALHQSAVDINSTRNLKKAMIIYNITTKLQVGELQKIFPGS